MSAEMKDDYFITKNGMPGKAIYREIAKICK